MAHTHHYRIVANLVMGLPDRDGFVPQMVVRQCRGCPHTESLFGAEHVGLQRNRLTYVEQWDDGDWASPRPEPFLFTWRA